MSETIIFYKGDIAKSKKKTDSELRVCNPEKWEDTKDEYTKVNIETKDLKEFKHKTKDEISFILQILHENTKIERDDIQNLLKANFAFDYDLFTFNCLLSDGSLCILQPLEVDEDKKLNLKVIIKSDRCDSFHKKVESIEKCFEAIELYLIRNKPTLSFDYFKENLNNYKKELDKKIIKERDEDFSMSVDSSEEDGDFLPKDDFFSDISEPTPNTKEKGEFQHE